MRLNIDKIKKFFDVINDFFILEAINNYINKNLNLNYN